MYSIQQLYIHEINIIFIFQFFEFMNPEKKLTLNKITLNKPQ